MCTSIIWSTLHTTRHNVLTYSIIENDQVLTYIATIDWDYIAPEVLSKVAVPSINTDLYQLGVLMYFITFFTPNKRKQKMELNLLRIDEAEKYFMDKQINP